MSLQKETIFKIGQKIIYCQPSWDITADKIEKLKSCFAIFYKVDAETIEVLFEERHETVFDKFLEMVGDIPNPECSKTIFASENGLTFKADNNYSVHQNMTGLKANFDLNTVENLNIFLESISDGNIDGVISFA